MKIYLLDDNRIQRYVLPTQMDEDFIIHYKTLDGENTVITIVVDNNRWNLKSNNEVSIIKDGVMQNNCFINLYECINLQIFSRKVCVYALPVCDDKLSYVSYNSELNKVINIGKGNKSNIVYDSDFIDDINASIYKDNGSYYIKESEKCNNKIYLNDAHITYSELKYGDSLFIGGLIIIWMKDFFIMNNPQGKAMAVGFNNYAPGTMNNSVLGVKEIPNAKIYNSDQLFYHIPRIRNLLLDTEVVIDEPPTKNEKENIPAILTMGTSITMLGSSAIIIFSIINGLRDNRPIYDMLPEIIMVGALILGSIVMPRLLQKARERQIARRERKGRNKYKVYLKSKEDYINGLLKQQTDIMLENNPSGQECYDKIVKTPLNMLNRLIWNREIVDEDFLNIRLGLGKLSSNINIKCPEERFSIDDNPLLDMVFKLKEQSTYIDNVPVTYSLVKNNITSFIFNCNFQDNYINSIMVQLMANHSGADLKIVILTSVGNEKKWECYTPISHMWNNEKTMRFFASSQEEYEAISSYLLEEYKERKEKDADNKQKDDYKEYTPYYLIITDDYQNVKSIPIIDNILKTDTNYGFSLLTISNNMKNLPNRCEWFIQFGQENSCIIKRELTKANQIVFNNEFLPNVNLDLAIKRIANIPLLESDGVLSFPSTLPFLEMMGVSKIEQLNIANRWSLNNPVLSLSTVIGFKSNQEEFKLDLHEKFHGPHGLIAGSTGSGKSEFIMTFILSMAINYHPDEVQFVLIDYKGGGLAGAFENKETGIKLPHLVGTITNLDTSEMNRTLISLQSELKKRQKRFNEVRDSLGEGTIDIYKYQRLYREGVIKKPMSHLFIICDEFAELKSQQPDFMGELISISRIGRSLGVHLILATQKPSGVVDDQIWSNSRFKVCLKVQTKEDSNEMLKRPDAASIKDVGRFFLQVGYDDYFEEGQSGWSGAMYIPTDTIIKKIDDSVNFINNIGFSIKSINNVINKDNNASKGDQLSNIIKYIYNIANKEGIKTNNLWLDNIDSNIYIENLKQKYDFKPTSYHINPIIGEYDNPGEQKQELLNLDLTYDSNVIVYGKTGSGTEELMQTIVWSLFTSYSVKEVNIYIIDCGSEVLNIYNNVPHIGKIAGTNDDEAIKDIIKFAKKEIEYRKELFFNYGGNYLNYIKSDADNKVPLMVFIINGYDSFNELYTDNIDEVITLFREGPKYGIKFIITSTNPGSVQFRIAQLFDNILTLQLNDPADYRMVLTTDSKIVPSKTLGRGLCKIGKNVFEFQTAFICPVNSFNEYLMKVVNYIRSINNNMAKIVPSVPNVVLPSYMMKYLTSNNKIPIGFDIKTKEICYFELGKYNLSIIACDELMENIRFINGIISILSNTNNIYIFDFQDILNKRDNIIKDNFKEFIPKIKDIFTQDSSNKIFVFVGLSPLKTETKDIYKEYIEVLDKINTLNHTKVLLISDNGDFGEYKFENWYKNSVNKKNGLWLGTNFDNQTIIDSSLVTYEDNKIEFSDMGYLVKNSKYKIVKLVNGEKENEK